jgi:N-acyl-L-homoserine lactone synthetase
MTISPEAERNQISIEEITVPLDSEVFEDNPDAEFYIGLVAVAGAVTMPDEYDAWLKFRANVYVKEMGFLDERSLDEQGRESDEDDSRSAHFVVLHNDRDRGETRVVGGARLIMKNDFNDQLPVERMYDRTFHEVPAPVGSTEASRLISRFERRGVQGAIGMALIRSMAIWTYDNGRKPVLAVIEDDKLGKIFQRVKLPYEAISEPEYIPEYRTVNTAIMIDPAEVLATIEPENHIDAPMMQAFYAGVEAHKGLGYFGKSLMKASEHVG